MVTDSHQHADGKVHAHITPVRFYWIIFFALIFFTLLTVGVAYVHLGPLNLVVAIVIATIKASLVVLYFMHMKYETKFNALVFLASLLFMGIFLAYTMNDTQYRASVDYAYGGRVDPRTGQYAHGTPPGLVAQMEALGEREAVKAREVRQVVTGYEADRGVDLGKPLEQTGTGIADTAEAGAAAQIAAEEGRIEPEEVPEAAKLPEGANPPDEEASEGDEPQD
jgi:cytochrome c oxidase subunit IV